MKSAPPYIESVGSHPLPFDLWPFQQEAVNTLAPLLHSAYYAEVGTGKTAMSTAHVNYQRLIGMADVYIVTCPPILIPMWVRWLERVPGSKPLAYRGPPKERAQLALEGHGFIVMSLDIFKRDQARLLAFADKTKVGLVVDEATAIKNIESLNHRCVRGFSVGRPLVLLTGTPLATPADGYAYIKLLAPGVYRSQRVFESIHVEKRDFFGNVTAWGNLDLLTQNMKVNSVRLLKEDHLPELAKPIYSPIPYDLDPQHMALYNRIAEEQLLELESGGKIDATSVMKLYTCLQQVVMNWAHFSENPDNISAGFELLDQVCSEVGVDRPDGGKLIVFGNYRMTMASIRKHLGKFGVRLINSEVSAKQREQGVEDFVNGKDCRVIAIQPRSGGFGLDGLQTVSSDVLFLECPTSPINFEQAVGRVYRTGQQRAPHIRIAVAQKTLQVRLHQMLLKNNELVNYVQGGFESLREALYGGEV